MPAESQAIFASGRLLYVQSGNLVSRPFDPDRLAFTGDPITLAGDIRSLGNTFRSPFSASQTGMLVYIAGRWDGYGLSWMDRSGQRIELARGLDDVNAVALAPDFRRAAFVHENGRSTVDLDCGSRPWRRHSFYAGCFRFSIPGLAFRRSQRHLRFEPPRKH